MRQKIDTIKSHMIQVAKISVLGRSCLDADIEGSRREFEQWRRDGETGARFEIIEVDADAFELLPEFWGF